MIENIYLLMLVKVERLDVNLICIAFISTPVEGKENLYVRCDEGDAMLMSHLSSRLRSECS